MVKHTQTIRRFFVFDHFVGLALKGLTFSQTKIYSYHVISPFLEHLASFHMYCYLPFICMYSRSFKNLNVFLINHSTYKTPRSATFAQSFYYVTITRKK